MMKYMGTKRNCLQGLVILLTAIITLPLFADEVQKVEPKKDDTVGLSISLISEVKSIQPGESFKVGVKIKHDPGFHTYWKSSGIVGVPTQVKWDLPEGFEVSSIHWPYPELSKMAEYPCFGYERDIVLFMTVTPAKMINEKSVTLKANVNWMCCSNTCHPGFKTFTLNLPIGTGESDAKLTQLFQQALDEEPKTTKAIKATMVPREDARKIMVKISASEQIKIEYVFNSDGQTTPDLSSSLKKLDDHTWLYEAQRSEYSPKPSIQFPMVLKTSDGYFSIVAE